MWLLIKYSLLIVM